MVSPLKVSSGQFPFHCSLGVSTRKARLAGVPHPVVDIVAKKVVDNGQNYTEKMKSDLKEIIDHGKSPEEICEATLAYFAMHRWY